MKKPSQSMLDASGPTLTEHLSNSNQTSSFQMLLQSKLRPYLQFPIDIGPILHYTVHLCLQHDWGNVDFLHDRSQTYLRCRDNQTLLSLR
jgi:hypothetical protein